MILNLIHSSVLSRGIVKKRTFFQYSVHLLSLPMFGITVCFVFGDKVVSFAVAFSNCSFFGVSFKNDAFPMSLVFNSPHFEQNFQMSVYSIVPLHF